MTDLAYICPDPEAWMLRVFRRRSYEDGGHVLLAERPMKIALLHGSSSVWGQICGCAAESLTAMGYAPATAWESMRLGAIAWCDVTPTAGRQHQWP